MINLTETLFLKRYSAYDNTVVFVVGRFEWAGACDSLAEEPGHITITTANTPN